MIHTLPDRLPESIVGAAESLNGETYEATLREIGALKGSDSRVTETYAGAAARTLKDIRTMLAEAKSYSYGGVFERGQRSWQIALDNVVNTVYKTADKETRKLIIRVAHSAGYAVRGGKAAAGNAVSGQRYDRMGRTDEPV